MLSIGVKAQESALGVDQMRDAYYKVFQGKKLIFISILQATDLGQGWFQGMKDALEPLGMTVEVRDSNLSTSAGAQAFAQAIAEKPAVIVAWNPDLTAYARLIQQAEAQGIYVISVNQRSNVAADGYIGPDWVKVGEIEAESAIERCKGNSGKVAIVQGQATSASNALAMSGINDVLQANPKIQVVSNQAADWDANKAKGITTTVLKAHPDLCAVIGSWEGMDVGIAAAVREANLNGKVAVITSGSSSQQSACNQVKGGTWDEYISYNLPIQEVQLNTVITALMSSGVKPAGFSSISYSVLTRINKSNVDQPNTCWAARQ